jgi:hypothetical protein
MWADRYLDRLYQEISWGGKTYGVIKSHPGIPIALELRNFPVPYLQTGDYFITKFTECGECEVIPHVKWWEEEVETDMHITVQIEHLDFYYGGKIVAGFTVARYAPAKDTTKLRVEVTVVSGPPSGVEADLYIGNLKRLTSIKKGDKVVIEIPNFGCLPSYEYSIRDCNFMAYYYWYNRPALRDRARKLFALLNDFNVKPIPVGVWFRQTDTLPDDWVCDVEGIYKDCPNGILNTLPRAIGFYPHISRCCVCRKDCKSFTCIVWEVHLSGYVNAEWAAMRAMHLLNKYGNPKVKDELGNSAEDYLVNGWWGYCKYDKGLCVDLRKHTGLIDKWIFDKGLKVSTAEVAWIDLYSCPPALLAAASMLGYGFGYDECKAVADNMVDLALKFQWGYPFDRPEKWYWDIRPDHAGGFISAWEWDSVPTYHEPPIWLSDVQAGRFTRDWYEEYLLPTFADFTMRMAQALRIYEAYKFRLGG